MSMRIDTAQLARVLGRARELATQDRPAAQVAQTLASEFDLPPARASAVMLLVAAGPKGPTRWHSGERAGATLRTSRAGVEAEWRRLAAASPDIAAELAAIVKLAEGDNDLKRILGPNPGIIEELTMSELPIRPELEAKLRKALAASGMQATLKLDLHGVGGGVYYVQARDDVKVVARADRVDVILRATPATLERLLSGRATLPDLVVAERVRLSGDLAKIAELQIVIESMSNPVG